MTSNTGKIDTMTEKMILSKLEAMEHWQPSIEAKIDELVKAVTKIAVQNERINNIEKDVKVLYKDHNNIYSPNGFFSVMKQHQATCPRDQIVWLWRGVGSMTVLGLMALGLMITAYVQLSDFGAELAAVTEQVHQITDNLAL